MLYIYKVYGLKYDNTLYVFDIHDTDKSINLMFSENYDTFLKAFLQLILFIMILHVCNQNLSYRYSLIHLRDAQAHT